MSHGTYIQIMIRKILHYPIELYIWNQAGKNNSITSSFIAMNSWYVYASWKELIQ